VDSDRFDRFLPFAGVLAGLLLAAGLALTYSIPNSETGFEESFSWWQDNRGQHQISGLLLAPLVALMLVFFGAGLKRSLRHNGHDSGHGSVAFGGAILGAGGFALIGMLEGAATNAAQEGQREAVYALNPTSRDADARSAGHFDRSLKHGWWVQSCTHLPESHLISDDETRLCKRVPDRPDVPVQKRWL